MLYVSRGASAGADVLKPLLLLLLVVLADGAVVVFV